MVKENNENHWGNSVVTLPARPRQQRPQEELLKIEQEVMSLMQDLEAETDQSRQKIITARIWRPVKTGNAE
jgi:hypothetical protein